MKHFPVHFSCFLNSLLDLSGFGGTSGKRYEMLSSRSYRCNWVYVIAVLDGIFGQGHCCDCYEYELDNFDGIQD